MNSADIGGLHWPEPIPGITREDPPFHLEWERRLVGVTGCLRVFWARTAQRGWHGFRPHTEALNPRDYIAYGYYGRWLSSLEKVLIEFGLVSREDLLARRGAEFSGELPRPRLGVPNGEEMSTFVRTIPKRGIDDGGAGRFAVGDMVRTIRMQPKTHTRLPIYARGKLGTVVANRGLFALPDRGPLGLPELQVHVYTVAFAGEELWGDDANPNSSVCLEMFDSYLEEVKL